MRLIDADALLNDPANISSNEFGDDIVYVEDINNAPTILGWIPITTRPLTDEEREQYDDEVTSIFTCKLPEDGEYVLITTSWGTVCTDCFSYDYFGFFEDHPDEGDVIAWMPLPTPYMKEGEMNETQI